MILIKIAIRYLKSSYLKHIFAFLLLMIIPTFCWADLVGSVDGRRYVTEEEKGLPPYNKIVRIQTDSGYSTGTIIAPNVILTCKHCVSSAGKNGSVNVYMPNGLDKIGTVWYYPDENLITNDYALVVLEDSDAGPFLNVSDVSVPDDNVMRIGYDFLKVLDKNEIPVVKKAFADAIGKYKKISNENIDDAIDSIEENLQKHSCKSGNSVGCVKCSNQISCIFNDGENMKVQNSCSATRIQPIDTGGTMLLTDCAGSPGGSGSPLIDSRHENIIGIFTGTYGFNVGGKAESYGVRPEVFSSKTKTFINMMDAGFVDF